MIRRHHARALMLGLALLFTPSLSHSAEDGTVVTGKVDLPPPSARKSAPKRGEAFIPRAKNPLRPPDGLDPRSQIVVFLEGGPVDPTDRKPRASRYEIVGENFKSDILPVVVGGKVEIKNMGRKSPRLYSKTNADVVPGDPINVKGLRVTQPITEALKPIDIREKDSVHFLAHIVAFEHGYFSLVDHAGKFEIKGVPDGTWKVKIWYGDGWVSNLPETSVTVGKRTKPVKVLLPAKLTTGASAQ